MSKVKTVCASIALMLIATTANAGQAKPGANSQAIPAQKWEFHGCAAIPVPDKSAAKAKNETAATLALRLKEAAKKR